MRSRNCGWCTEQYEQKDSDAHDRSIYCSRDCELKDTGEGESGYSGRIRRQRDSFPKK